MNAFDLGAVPRTAADWNQLWGAKQQLRSMDHDAQYWNERAKTYTNKDNPDSYTHAFLRLAALKPGDTVFDMGCGTGNLTIPLAEAGHEVCAADFSSGMLDRLRDAVRERGLEEHVTIKKLSWDDDWEAALQELGHFDACLASRSIATDDLLGALTKLNHVCKRRGCLTLPCGPSPRTDERMLEAIGLPVHPSFDDCYALAMLSDLGQLPTLDYIPTQRNDSFASREAAEEHCLRMAEGFAADNRLPWDQEKMSQRIQQWLDASLVPDAQEPGRLTYATPRLSHWAFVSWNKR